MKKKLQLFSKKWFLLVGLAGSLSTAQVSTFPWMETFEDTSSTSSQWICQYISGTNSNVPNGLFWSIKTVTSVGYYNSTGPYQGAKMAVFDTRSHSNGTARFISPIMDLTVISSPVLDFYYRNMIWDDDQNVLRIFYRISQQDPWVLITSFNSNQPSWINSGNISLPNPSATYQIALEGEAHYGYGLDVDNLQVTGVLSISGVNPKLDFKVYPNPVKDILNISYTQNITNIEVYNLLGQKVATKAVNTNQGQVGMSHLASGTYLVKITADNQTKTIKVIKQ